MRQSYLFLVLLLTVSIFQSCVKDPNTTDPEPEVAPQLPPQEAFVMPFTVIDETDTNPEEVNNTNNNNITTSFSNWFHSAGNVLIWNAVLTINMAIPVASFKEAFNHSAEYVGNGVFAWAYNFNIGQESFNARLTGEFINNGDDVEWIMMISKVGGFTDVEWYRGVVAVDGTKANWTLNHQGNNPQPFISIEYHKDETTLSSIRYSNIIPNNPNNGDYIEYRITPNETFNRAYDVYLGSPAEFLEILWDEPSYEGQVKHPIHFGDEEWHCWNDNQMNIDC